MHSLHEHGYAADMPLEPMFHDLHCRSSFMSIFYCWNQGAGKREMWMLQTRQNSEHFVIRISRPRAIVKYQITAHFSTYQTYNRHPLQTPQKSIHQRTLHNGSQYFVEKYI